MKIENGFYTALGTSLTVDGKLIENAFKKHIEQQIEANASGLLVLGSMGIQPSVLLSECTKAVNVAIDAIDGRVPLFVGVMDNSIAKVKQRLNLIGAGRKIDGVVVTAPYYCPPEIADVIY